MLKEELASAAVNKLKTKTVSTFRYLIQLLKTKSITIVVQDENGYDYPIKLHLCINKKFINKQLKKAQKSIVNVSNQTRNSIDLGDTYVDQKTHEPIGYEIREFLSKERFLPNIPKENWDKYLPLLREQSLPLSLLMGSQWEQH